MATTDPDGKTDTFSTPSTSGTANAPLSTEALWGRGSPCPYDIVIDVRSPGEYAEDHIPGAINLPVLNDAERAEVGTIYNRVGAFAARKVGAALISTNIGQHIREHFADKGREYRPLVYCWRGGHRSASLAIVLAHVGWRVTVLKGGYKTYRGHVRRELETLPLQFEYKLLAGATGTGKTRLLHALASRGAQVLDLEGLAHHRGSLLGRVGPQPSQKYFDSLQVAAFDRFTLSQPIWVEAESNRIGDVFLPPALWTMLRAAEGFALQVPIEGRVQHLLADYAHLLADTDTLKSKLSQLTSWHGPSQIQAWHYQIDAGDWSALVASLLAVHYDPAYAKSARRCYPNVTQCVTMPDASPAAIDAAARGLLAGGAAKAGRGLAVEARDD